MRRAARAVLVLAVALCVGCSSSTPSASSPEPDASAADASVLDAGAPDSGPGDAADDVDKAAPCATSFGSALTNAFGRLDGTVLAIVPPNDQACALPNSTHLVIQVTIAGVAYRMVVDVVSDQLSEAGSDDDLLYETDAPLAAGPWSEGWHPGVALDYVTTLAVHSASFVPIAEGDFVDRITSEITLGAHISVFATSDGEPNSAHLVHRNATNADGAIVIAPDSANPHYILLCFSEQSF